MGKKVAPARVPKTTPSVSQSDNPEIQAGRRIAAALDAACALYGTDYQSIAADLGRDPSSISHWKRGGAPRPNIFKLWQQKFKFPIAAWWMDGDPERLPGPWKKWINENYPGGLLELSD